MTTTNNTDTTPQIDGKITSIGIYQVLAKQASALHYKEQNITMWFHTLKLKSVLTGEVAIVSAMSLDAVALTEGKCYEMRIDTAMAVSPDLPLSCDNWLVYADEYPLEDPLLDSLNHTAKFEFYI